MAKDGMGCSLMGWMRDITLGDVKENEENCIVQEEVGKTQK